MRTENDEVKDKQARQRKHTKALREWRKKNGFVRVEVWVHQEDRAAIIAESVKMYNAKMRELDGN